MSDDFPSAHREMVRKKINLYLPLSIFFFNNENWYAKPLAHPFFSLFVLYISRT
jgi:hypothetical protein